MKLFGFLFVLSVLQYSYQEKPGIPEDDEATVDLCIKSSNAAEATVESFYTEGKFVEDNNFKCFLKCVYVQQGEMTDAGQILPDVMKSHPDPDMTVAQTAQIVDACKATTGKDPCDTAYQVTKCLVDQAVKLLG